MKINIFEDQSFGLVSPFWKDFSLVTFFCFW